MGDYGYPNQNVQTIPTIGDYIKWMILPGLLGMVTCGIGTIVLMIVWATDNRNIARANYFKALFALMGIGIALSIVLFIFVIGGTSLLLNSI